MGQISERHCENEYIKQARPSSTDSNTRAQTDARTVSRSLTHSERFGIAATIDATALPVFDGLTGTRSRNGKPLLQREVRTLW
jgi:hypothetical protein